MISLWMPEGSSAIRRMITRSYVEIDIGQEILMKLTHIVATFCLFATALTLCLPTAKAAPGDDADTLASKIPVIYDSDIGDDIDDTWALCMLLKSPELDVKLVVGDQGKTVYRAKLFAKLLETAGRTDIPVGIGLKVNAKGEGGQRDWVADYDLKSYPGTVYEDGIQAIIDTIMKSPDPVTVIGVGPLPNIREALKREPRIAKNARFVGMHGSVRIGYEGSKTIAVEYNVKEDVKACQAVLSAPWNVSISPLDTCGIVVLRGDKFAAVRDCQSALTKALIENYRLWAKFHDRKINIEQQSSTLYDTVAVYLAFSQDLCEVETLPIRVTDEGKTVIDESAKSMSVATDWKDLSKFEDLLVERLIQD